MMHQRICPLACPSQLELDAFRRAGVDIMALATPIAMKVAVGSVAHDCRFEPDAIGQCWFAFEEPRVDDVVFWHWDKGQTATWSGRAFALGEEIIGDAATYSFDCALNVFADPLTWLQANRDGIVVLPGQWPLAFDRLRDAPRVALAEKLLPIYRRHMRPHHTPELSIIPERRRAA